MALYLGVIATLLVPGARNILFAGYLLLTLVIGISAIVGLPKNYYLAGVAVISIQGAFPIAGMMIGTPVDLASAIWMGCTLFITALLLLVWWVAAEPVWRWRGKSVIDEDGVYIPQAAEEDETSLPEARLRLEVLLSRLLIAVFTVFYTAAVVASAWLARAFGETEGMSHSESVWFVIIMLAFPIPAAILCLFRLPLTARQVVMGFLVALGIAVIWYLRAGLFEGHILAVLLPVPIFVIYGLVWWTATKPKSPAITEETGL